MPSGMCGEVDAGQKSGTCTSYDGPIACASIWQPVCGCDGKVYSNSCDANASGVNVLRDILDFDTAIPGGICEII